VDFFEGFPCLVHKLLVISATFENKPSEKWGRNLKAPAYNGFHEN
jgi:hypothetical protein